MLILELKLNDKIYIGTDTVLKFHEYYIRHENDELYIRLGFDAPREIQIDRENVYLSKLRHLREDTNAKP